MYDVALTESLPPCGEGGQFALRIGRMRGFAEGDRAVNDCLAAISVAGRQPFCRFATFPLERGITLIRHAAFVVMQNGNTLLSGNRR